MRAARKCGPTRGTHSTRCSSVRSRRQLRNPRQNPLKLQVSFNCRENVFLRQTMKSFLLRVRRNASHDAAIVSRSAALYHAHDCNLVASRRWTPTLPHPLSLSAVIHLIHLNRRTLQLHPLFREERANLAEHAPSGFVGDASFALNLLRGDAATSRTH